MVSPPHAPWLFQGCRNELGEGDLLCHSHLHLGGSLMPVHGSLSLLFFLFPWVFMCSTRFLSVLRARLQMLNISHNRIDNLRGLVSLQSLIALNIGTYIYIPSSSLVRLTGGHFFAQIRTR